MTPAAERRPLLPFGYARAHNVMLLGNGESCEVFCLAATAPQALLEARRVAGMPFSLERLEAEAFEKLLVLSYQRDSAEARRMMADIGNELDLYTLAEELPDTDDLLDSEDDAPIIRLINAMLTEAIKEKASDIHIETYERHLQIRFRVDGVLREILRPQRRLAALLISRIKVMASLDIAEKRIPQDGRMALRIGGRAVDVRVSTLPSSYGERVVLRLLDKNSVNLDLLTLGMSPALLQQVDGLIARPHGIVLVTGPTGSGKSTTLYAALSRLDARERNIMTIEDPIEYELEGIGQTQVNAKVDMTFARGLRAILRQDPDVVLVGEIRDGETAQIARSGFANWSSGALNAAHQQRAGRHLAPAGYGRRAFSALHLAAGGDVAAAGAPALPHCRQQEPANADTARQMEIAPGTALWQPRGCAECGFTGYRGRTGIHELLLVDDRVRMAIHRGENEVTLIQQLGADYITLRHAGRDKALAGITSWQEVLRVSEQQIAEAS